jgi:hypothetical protein
MINTSASWAMIKPKKIIPDPKITRWISGVLAT